MDRVAAIEAELAARPLHRKREPAPRPDDSDMDERDKWYADYLEAEMQYGGGRVNPKRAKAFLAEQQRFDVRALHRFLNRRDNHPIKKGSGQYIRVRDGILDETANLKKHGSGKIPQAEPYGFPHGNRGAHWTDKLAESMIRIERG